MRWIWRALTRRLLLKFTALLCAVVLWVYVDSATMVERELSVPVVLLHRIEVGIPGGRDDQLDQYRILRHDGLGFEEHPPRVRATIRGPRTRLDDVDPALLQAVVQNPLGSIREGRQCFRVSPDCIHGLNNTGFMAIAVSPEDVSFKAREAGPETQPKKP